jgi:hypothetical protein
MLRFRSSHPHRSTGFTDYPVFQCRVVRPGPAASEFATQGRNYFQPLPHDLLLRSGGFISYKIYGKFLARGLGSRQ